MDYNSTLSATNLGLVEADYTFLMAVSGLGISLCICAVILYLITQIAKGQ